MSDSTHFYETPEWRALREKVFARDAGRCTVARLLGGACGGTIQVHHIEPLRERWDLRLDEDNCACVCARHHPQWEALRRALVNRRVVQLPPCPHNHPYRSGREACERRRMREAGLLDDVQLAVA
jgi:CXCXC repeat